MSQELGRYCSERKLRTGISEGECREKDVHAGVELELEEIGEFLQNWLFCWAEGEAFLDDVLLEMGERKEALNERIQQPDFVDLNEDFGGQRVLGGELGDFLVRSNNALVFHDEKEFLHIDRAAFVDLDGEVLDIETVIDAVSTQKHVQKVAKMVVKFHAVVMLVFAQLDRELFLLPATQF